MVQDLDWRNEARRKIPKKRKKKGGLTFPRVKQNRINGGRKGGVQENAGGQPQGSA